MININNEGPELEEDEEEDSKQQSSMAKNPMSPETTKNLEDVSEMTEPANDQNLEINESLKKELLAVLAQM
jgi:hypothetical protein